MLRLRKHKPMPLALSAAFKQGNIYNIPTYLYSSGAAYKLVNVIIHLTYLQPFNEVITQQHHTYCH